MNNELQKKLSQCRRENEKLLKRNSQLQAAIEQVPEGILVTNTAGGKIQFVNPELVRILGISKHDLVGKTFTEAFFKTGGKVFYPDTPARITDPDIVGTHPLSGKHAVVKNFVVAIRQPAGQVLWVLMSSSPVLDSQNRNTAMVSTLRDITHRKKEEESLQKSNIRLKEEVRTHTIDLEKANRRLESILDNSSESIWVIDADGTVERINRKSEELLAIRPKDVVGKHYLELVNNDIVDQSVTLQAFNERRQVSMMQQALKTGRSLLVTSTPVFDQNGDISMMVVNERDLTQLNDLQSELDQVKNESDRMREALTELNLKELREQSVIAESKEMQQVIATALKLASLNISTILITGESGTGKGLLAKFIHDSCYGQKKKKGKKREKEENGVTRKINDADSNPKNQPAPFVQINCAALPETLLEAELFGYEKGAFTGAKDKGKMGLFEMAQGGTLFLDELGELSLPVQAKLLKCLEDKEIMHLGGLTPIKIDCTVIAATNVNLPEQVRQKEFRQDLFFRLNTFTLSLPPLRSRPEDILELALFFLKKYNHTYNMQRRLSSKAIEALQRYPFPGNVRELKNLIKKTVVMSDSDLLDDFQDISPHENRASQSRVERRSREPLHVDTTPIGESFDEMVGNFEKEILTKAMEQCTTTRAIAAYLNMTQSQVMRKIKKHKLSDQLKRNRRR